MTRGIWLSGLYRYPVKALRGKALPESRVELRGLAYDRRWMVVDERGKFLTQRQWPRLALVEVAIAPPTLQLQAPGMPALSLAQVPEGVEPITVEVWGDYCPALPMGSASQVWFSQYLGINCQLVYMPDNSLRPAGHGSVGEVPVSFADGYPFLLISQGSLDDLNQRLADPIPMNRFRPNLVVKGCEPFAEDTWAEVQIGEVTFRCVKPCSRCIVTTTDQATAQRSPEPLRTLATYRHHQGEILFGQNLIALNAGSIRLDAPVEILSRQ